jgi:hypothetical protein
MVDSTGIHEINIQMDENKFTVLCNTFEIGSRATKFIYLRGVGGNINHGTQSGNALSMLLNKLKQIVVIDKTTSITFYTEFTNDTHVESVIDILITECRGEFAQIGHGSMQNNS